MLNLETLMPVFGSDEITFLTDDTAVRQWLQDKGLSARSAYSTSTAPPENVVLVLLTWEGEVAPGDKRRLQETLSDSRVLYLPIGAFDNSFAAAKYTIEQVLCCDFESACKRSSKWADELRQLDLGQDLRFRGPDTDIDVALGSRLGTAARFEPELNPGENVSIISYFEIGLEAVGTGTSQYEVNGGMDVAGMLVARSSTLPAELHAKWQIACRLVHSLSARRDASIHVEVERNHVRSITVDGREMLPLFDELTNPIYHSRVVEFSVGTNESVSGRADWTINSLINEGHAGIHLGIGDGVTGPHIDFVCTDVTYETPTQKVA